MGSLVLLGMFVCFCVIAYYYPYIGLVLASLLFMFIFGGGLAVGILLGSFGGGKSPATIGHETFYTAIYVALITVSLPYIFAHLVAFYPHYRFVVIAIVTVLTLVLSWDGLSYGYQWEVSDVISKSCPTCTEFRSSRDTTVNGFRYAYRAEAPLNQCIVWDNAMATTQCLYPSAVASIGFVSILLALMNMGLTFWYTSEVEDDIIVIVTETANNEPS